MPNINLMNNSSTFALTEVNATTVGALRQEKDLGDAVINVDRTVASDDHILEDREEGNEMNVAVVNKDKRGGKPATMRRRKTGTTKRIRPEMRNNILLDVESGMPVSKAAKEYGVHHTTIYSWINNGVKPHRKLRTNDTDVNKTLSSTKVSKDGTLSVLSAETTKFPNAQVEEITLHLSGKHVPGIGQLRVTRGLLNYLNEVCANLAK